MGHMTEKRLQQQRERRKNETSEQRERRLERMREYQRTHKRESTDEQKEKKKLQWKKWYSKNKDKRREDWKKWYSKNKGTRQEYMSNYWHNNSDILSPKNVEQYYRRRYGMSKAEHDEIRRIERSERDLHRVEYKRDIRREYYRNNREKIREWYKRYILKRGRAIVSKVNLDNRLKKKRWALENCQNPIDTSHLSDDDIKLVNVHFHHIDPSIKTSILSKLAELDTKKYMDEAKKCVAVTSKEHNELHRAHQDPDLVHQMLTMMIMSSYQDMSDARLVTIYDKPNFTDMTSGVSYFIPYFCDS